MTENTVQQSSGTGILSGRASRLDGLDTLRGLTLISMMLYHACWDLVYLFSADWDWYRSAGAYLWQQSICWTFILLSGFCWSLGRHRLKRGLMAFGGGALVSLVTLAVMPEEPVWFGVLTLLGTAALLLIPLERVLRHVPAGAGLAGSFVLFLLLRNVNEGYLGFEGLRLARLPAGLYRNMATAFLGFPPAGFYSTDYFSLVPWVFLFLTGYFLHRLCRPGTGAGPRLPVVTAMGRNSLLIYLLHQPVIYGGLTVLHLAV